jgi:hypothetical protein
MHERACAKMPRATSRARLQPGAMAARNAIAAVVWAASMNADRLACNNATVAQRPTAGGPFVTGTARDASTVDTQRGFAYQRTYEPCNGHATSSSFSPPNGARPLTYA